VTSFERQLATGKVAEGLIAAWLMSRGTPVMPAYEIEKSHGKGPQLFAQAGEYVAPDMLAFAHDGIVWVEAKHKSVFSWHRHTRRWTTGIDIRHYEDYINVLAITKLPVWVLFYHRSATPSADDRLSGCPETCPTGLYGRSLADLQQLENHRSKPYDPTRPGFAGHGRSGMVYWSHASLLRIATKEQVESVPLRRVS
jgi:hypothetical protein